MHGGGFRHVWFVVRHDVREVQADGHDRQWRLDLHAGRGLERERLYGGRNEDSIAQLESGIGTNRILHAAKRLLLDLRARTGTHDSRVLFERQSTRSSKLRF